MIEFVPSNEVPLSHPTTQLKYLKISANYDGFFALKKETTASTRRNKLCYKLLHALIITLANIFSINYV